MQQALRQFKADIFQALAHPTRIAMVELLRDGEVPAGMIFAQVGVGQANASQHLAVLRAKRIVINRKVGNQMFYALRSHRLVEVLDAMRLYFQEHLSEAMEMLEEIKLEAPTSAAASGERNVVMPHPWDLLHGIVLAMGHPRALPSAAPGPGTGQYGRTPDAACGPPHADSGRPCRPDGVVRPPEAHRALLRGLP